MQIPSLDNSDPDRMESASTAVEASAANGGSSSALSFVSRAKKTLHSAAARAEKVLTEIKADLRNDRDGNEQAKIDSREMDEKEFSDDDGFNNPGDEEYSVLQISEASPTAALDCHNLSNKVKVPSASILKQLAAAYEAGKNFLCSKDLLRLVGDPVPTKEKSGLSFSVVKSLVLCEKEDKSHSDLSNDDELHSMLQFLFDSDKSFTQTNGGSCLTFLPVSLMPKVIRGAPPESFVLKLSEVVGGFKSLQKMASFWVCVISELRRLWSNELPVPWVPLEAEPDLDSCLLHQKLQVINCCISRKVRRNAAIKSLDSVIREGNLDKKGVVDSPDNSNSMRYARLVSGEYALRLGVDHLSENLTMLETGEPIYSPVTQEGPILTDELIKENEELVLRTGSFGAGCSQLLSDMQAFKAANPGCVLEDFIRWHSPPDWIGMESSSKANDHNSGEGSSRGGKLSKRMLKEGNLWQELWRSAKATPAVQQTPVFDEDLAVESIFTSLEDIPPSELLEQLFVSMLCSAFTTAEASISPDSRLSKVFYECKDWVIAACQNGISSENIGDICKVYETVETIITHPEEAITILDHPEEPKSRFSRMNLNFVKKDLHLLRKRPPKNEKQPKETKSGEKQTRVFSQLFDKKSIFSKKQPKLKRASASEPDLDVNDWTIV